MCIEHYLPKKKKCLPTGTERLDGHVLFSFSIALLIVLAGVFLLLAARLSRFPWGEGNRVANQGLHSYI